VRVTAARFLGAVARPGAEPPAGLPEVAIAGRSNVGKSSLLNRLVGRRGLARISATPGRTRQLNFFVLNERFVLVDLPGYGFAVGPERERLAWGPLVEGYLLRRATLRGVVLVVDVRRGLEAEEAQVLDFLASAAVPAAVVATKLDKLARGAARLALERIAGQATTGLPVVGFSARSGEGREALSRIIGGWIAGPPRPAGAT